MKNIYSSINSAMNLADNVVNLITEEFTDNVKIHPRDITNDMSKSILDVLKKQKEGICSNHGFIKKDSIQLCEIGPGKVELTSFHGYINYTVKYSAQVCNPVKDDIVSATVQNINNFGILCTSTVSDETVLEIIVPKHSPAIVSSINLENVKYGDNVMVQIIGKKYQLYNKKISIIGKIVVDHSTVSINLDKLADPIQTNIDSDDEELGGLEESDDDDDRSEISDEDQSVRESDIDESVEDDTEQVYAVDIDSEDDTSDEDDDDES